MVDLKSGIVIVNEFSVPKPGGRGSRGSTPGAYVTRYMARDDATETLAPVRYHRTDDFITRYMARACATETALTPAQLQKGLQPTGLGGIAFGYGSMSLSHDQVRAAAHDIQHLFESGHTVMKTVMSFDEEYLRARHLIDPDFHLVHRGDYRGHVDQMKLRMAVSAGMARMSHAGFDDLRWIGVVQFDTRHVHVHLAMVDAGVGRLMPDGTQRGKLLDIHQSRLRRGTDAFLDAKSRVARLSAAFGYERRNVVSYVKRWAHETMATESLPQFLVACLPADKRLWRAGSHHREMRKADALAHDLVEQVLARPDSPMSAAMERVHAYADHRRDAEGLSSRQWSRLVERGRADIVDRGVNGVYRMIATLPPDELRVRTPMLDLMSTDYQRLAARTGARHETDDADDELMAFGMRLRTYGSRLRYHRQKAHEYHEAAREWDRADAAGVARPESRPLFDLYRFEEEYHAGLVAKYRHFLPVLDALDDWRPRIEAAADHGRDLVGLIELRGDASLGAMKDPDVAETIGRQVYGRPGGALLTRGAAGRAVLDDRITRMRASHRRMITDLAADMAADGLVLRPARDPDAEGLITVLDENGEPASPLEAVADDSRDFSRVRGLDLHHMGYDFFSDVEIADAVADRFTATTRRRRALLTAAMDYLEASGQSGTIGTLPVDDIAEMVRFDTAMEARRRRTGRPVLLSRFAELRAGEQADAPVHRLAATPLDEGLEAALRRGIEASVTNEPEDEDIDELSGEDPEQGL